MCNSLCFFHRRQVDISPKAINGKQLGFFVRLSDPEQPVIGHLHIHCVLTNMFTSNGDKLRSSNIPLAKVCEVLQAEEGGGDTPAQNPRKLVLKSVTKQAPTEDERAFTVYPTSAQSNQAAVASLYGMEMYKQGRQKIHQTAAFDILLQWQNNEISGQEVQNLTGQVEDGPALRSAWLYPDPPTDGTIPVFFEDDEITVVPYNFSHRRHESGSAAALSFVHLLAIPKRRIYSALTLDPTHCMLLQNLMRRVSELITSHDAVRDHYLVDKDLEISSKAFDSHSLDFFVAIPSEGDEGDEDESSAGTSSAKFKRGSREREEIESGAATFAESRFQVHCCLTDLESANGEAMLPYMIRLNDIITMLRPGGVDPTELAQQIKQHQQMGSNSRMRLASEAQRDTMQMKLLQNIQSANDQGRVKMFEDGELLLCQDDPVTENSAIFIIIQGSVSVVVDGVEIAVRQSTYVGEGAVLGENRTADVVAKGCVVCEQYTRAEFLQSHFAKQLTSSSSSSSEEHTAAIGGPLNAQHAASVSNPVHLPRPLTSSSLPIGDSSKQEEADDDDDDDLEEEAHQVDI
jgi:hypothetical protein